MCAGRNGGYRYITNELVRAAQAELGFELCDRRSREDRRPSESRSRQTDRNDAGSATSLLRLMGENNFPQICGGARRIEILRQLLWHRHRLVPMRTRIMNQTAGTGDERRAIAAQKKKLFSEQGREQLEKAVVSALGPVGAGKSCWSCWTACIRRSKNCCSCCRAGSQEATWPSGSPLDDASWRGPAYGPRVCVDHRDCESL